MARLTIGCGELAGLVDAFSPGRVRSEDGKSLRVTAGSTELDLSSAEVRSLGLSVGGLVLTVDAVVRDGVLTADFR